MHKNGSVIWKIYDHTIKHLLETRCLSFFYVQKLGGQKSENRNLPPPHWIYNESEAAARES